MDLNSTHTEDFRRLLTDTNNKMLGRHKENITTIILSLDLLEEVNESRSNKELVQIIRHSFQRLLKGFSEDENTGPHHPP